jgi:glutathione S-transferase
VTRETIGEAGGAEAGSRLSHILYSENGSPFSAPVRIAVYAKKLDIEIRPPPGGLKSSAFHAINPVGTIPCLVRSDGFTLPESSAILEYLDECFPTPPLLPPDPDSRARVRMLQRIAQLGIMNSCVDLLQAADTEARDSRLVSNHLTRLVRSMASLQLFLTDAKFAVGQTFTLADCQIAPALFGVPKAAGAFGTRNLIEAYPEVAHYYASCREHPAVRRVLGEMREAIPAH